MCVHHMEGSHMIHDLYRERRRKRPRVLVGGGQDDEEEPPGADHVDHLEDLHSKCGTPEGCQCDLCKDGKCLQVAYHPFANDGEDHSMRDRLDAMERLVLCSEEDRTHKCYKGDCEACGWEMNLHLRLCPLERNNDIVKVKIRTYEAPGVAVPTSLDGNDGNDDDDAEGEGDEDYIPDAKEAATRKAMHWRFVTITRGRMWEHCMKRFKSFILHRKRAREQHEAYERCKRNLKPGHAMILLDFAMNYSHDYMKEAQSQFYIKTQTTILPVVVWINKGGQLTGMRNYVYLSPDTNHSNKIVQHVINQV